jgi:hypothetical protein
MWRKREKRLSKSRYPVARQQDDALWKHGKAAMAGRLLCSLLGGASA